MKKIIVLIFIAFSYLLSPFPVEAQGWQADYGAWSSAFQGSAAGGVSTVADIINLFIPSVLVLAGLILFAMLLFGGFTMLTGAANKESQEKGKKMVTSALTGFFVIFLAYWIAQILQVIFGIGIISQ